jgi:HEPN domain-containing protein
MKGPDDLVRDWLRKAESDLTALDLAVSAGAALDTACFHAQQAAEKYVKAFLLARKVQFPFTHNLLRLVALCETQDPEFASLVPLAELLSPYAVELRYDAEFWPSLATARKAQEAALTFKEFVLQRLPPRR